jgi:hypothetical protein
MGGPEMGGLKWGPESAHCAAYGCSPHCYQGVHQAASLADAKRSDFARLLGTSSCLLKEGRARF